jgi:hypothetical protein
MENEHSKPTEQLNTSQATAILSYSGLALFYFIPKSAFRAQILRRPDHDFSFSVTKVEPSGSYDLDLGALDIESDIHFEVVNPAKSGFLRFEKGNFEIDGKQNDKNDFRWIVDMEGPKLHGKSLQKLRPSSAGSQIRLQELAVSDGTVYTSRISKEVYGRETLGQPNEPGVLIGQIAQEVSVNLECRDEAGSGLRILNPKTKKPLWLPKEKDVQYKINVKNICDVDMTGGQGASDFVLYYDVLRDPGDVRYDLKRVVDSNAPEARMRIVDFDHLAIDGDLIMCDGIYLRRTSGW